MSRRPDPDALAAALLRPSRRPAAPRPSGGSAAAIALVLVGAVTAMAALIAGYLLVPRASLFGGTNSGARRTAGAVALVVAPLLPLLTGALGARAARSSVWLVLGAVFAVPIAAISVYIALG